MSLGDELEALRATAGVVDTSERGAVLVTGPEAWSYLQSLVSADLDTVGDGTGVHSLLLTPQGKLDVDFRLLRVRDEAWLDCDPGFGEQLAASLNRFRIRVKCDVTDRTGSWGSLAVRGPGAVDVASALGVEPPVAPHAHVPFDDAVVVRAPWPGGDGFDVVGPPSAVASAADRLKAAGVASCSSDAHEALRIEVGVPRQGYDLDEKTIPQEAFLERDAVSFSKGCFLGQELVCRIDTRGRVNRYLRRLTTIAARRGWPVQRFTARGTPSPVQIVRSTLAIGSILPALVVGAVPGVLNRSRRDMVNFAIATWGEFGTALAGVRLAVRGEEHLWSRRPAVFVFNHQSAIDVLLLCKLLRRDFSGVAKKEARANPLFGPVFYLAGVVFIDRLDRQKAIEALRPAIATLREGTSFVIAPEGTRSPTLRPGPFKKGAFHLAMGARVPIVPIVFRNALDALPKHGLVIRPATVDVVVHPPIPTDDWTLDTLDRRIAEVRALFLDTFERFDAPVA